MSCQTACGCAVAKPSVASWEGRKGPTRHYARTRRHTCHPAQALFRPVSMVVPDSACVAEVLLFCEGFSAAPWLAHKAVAAYRLAEEQLSCQARARLMLLPVLRSDRRELLHSLSLAVGRARACDLHMRGTARPPTRFSTRTTLACGRSRCCSRWPASCGAPLPTSRRLCCCCARCVARTCQSCCLRCAPAAAHRQRCVRLHQHGCGGMRGCSTQQR